MYQLLSAVRLVETGIGCFVETKVDGLVQVEVRWNCFDDVGWQDYYRLAGHAVTGHALRTGAARPVGRPQREALNPRVTRRRVASDSRDITG